MRAGQWQHVAVAVLAAVVGAGCGRDALPGPTCDPGRAVACVGPGSCAGWKQCNAFGTGYSSCSCAPPVDGGGGVDAATDGRVDAGRDAPRPDARLDTGPWPDSGPCSHCGTQACCNGICTDTNTDTNNCGQCGNACLPGRAPDCVMGLCGCAGNTGQPCAGGATCCSNGCKNLLADAYNCGECGRKCAGNQGCVNGACSCGGVTCTGTRICCANVCVDKNTDRNNCGFCGNQCQAGRPCVNGLCQGTNNCGPGGTPCPYGQQCCPNICCSVCLGGVCMDGPDAGT